VIVTSNILRAALRERFWRNDRSKPLCCEWVEENESRKWVRWWIWRKSERGLKLWRSFKF